MSCKIITIDLANVPPIPIRLGVAGENTFRTITFDATKWGADFPGATYTVVYKRPDGYLYPVLVNAAADAIVWSPTETDTATSGSGLLEVRLLDGETVGKTITMQTVVAPSLTGNESTPPQPAPDWVNDVAADADRAELAVTHYPKIVNGVWHVWSVQDEDYVSTGIEAQGEDGYSPTVTVTEIDGGHRVTITDADGAHTFDVMDGEGGPGGGAVTSVNGKTGTVVLDASDVGALPNNTPIPAAVTEQTVAGWGFTKNTGTYSKPSGGIPKRDLASAVQTSLGKADTALQQHQSLAGYATETYVQTQIAAIPDELPSVTTTDNGKVLAVDNGEWSADSPVIVSGTDAQVTNAVNDYLTQYGVPLRLSEEIKQALLDCFENVAWINEDGQTYYDALYAALYPPVDVLSISAVFTQGDNVIYDTDDLDTLKQYLTVTATYDDTSTGAVTKYTLSGTLTVGTSTITVSYGGKTTTFTVTVTGRDVIPAEYQKVEYIENTGTAYIVTQLQMQLGYKVKAKAYRASKPNGTQVVVGGRVALWNYAFLAYSASSENRIGSFHSTTINAFTNLSGLYNGFVEAETVFRANQISVSLKNSTATETATANGSPAVSSLALFSTGDTQEPLYFIGRIASVSVEDGNGNAVGNLIPCYRKSDSVVGMYDTVNSLFYTSDSSDVFTKGGDVA